jgi:hypothetical protein
VDVPIPARLFSLAEANAMVPLLRERFVVARELRDRLVEAQKLLGEAGRPIDGPEIQIDAAAPAHIQQMQRGAIEAVAALRTLLREVAELGVEVKAADGLVDFRSKLHGHVVYLCWKFGEERVSHYHELDAGFAGRQPLPSDADFLGDLLH